MPEKIRTMKTIWCQVSDDEPITSETLARFAFKHHHSLSTSSCSDNLMMTNAGYPTSRLLWKRRSGCGQMEQKCRAIVNRSSCLPSLSQHSCFGAPWIEFEYDEENMTKCIFLRTWCFLDMRCLQEPISILTRLFTSGGDNHHSYYQHHYSTNIQHHYSEIQMSHFRDPNLFPDPHTHIPER